MWNPRGGVGQRAFRIEVGAVRAGEALRALHDIGAAVKPRGASRAASSP